MPESAAILLIASQTSRALRLEEALRCGDYTPVRLSLPAAGAELPAAAAIVADLEPSQLPMLRELRSRAAWRDLPLLLVCAADALDWVRTLSAREFVVGEYSGEELSMRLAHMLREHALHQELSHKQRAAQLALELTRTLSSALDFREILFTVVRRIAEVVRISRVSIVITPQDEPDTGYVIAASDDQEVSNLRLDLSKYPEIQQVLRTGEGLTIDDVNTHPVLDGVRDSVPPVSALSLLPIRWQDHVVGVLFLRALAPSERLSQAELELCMIIANATGAALRSAHLMQKLRKDHRDAQAAQNQAEEQAQRERDTAAELRKTKEFLESLIEASVDAIVAADLKGTIILYNKGAERIYGRKAEEVVGRMHVSSLYPDGVAQEIMKRIRSPEYGGVGRLEDMHAAAVDKAGNLIPIALSAAMIYEHDRPTATVGIFTDLREKLMAEERLAQVKKKLEVSEKQALLAELAGTAAHELNQPLTSVMGYGELLIRRLPAGTPERNAAQVIMQEAERMANLVRKIGKITRYETKSYVGDQRILDLDRAAADAPAADEEP